MDIGDLYIIGYLVGTLPFGVLLLKGKGWLTLISLFATFLPPAGTVIAVIGAGRLAKPYSWWARRWYGEGKMRAAGERYPGGGERAATVLAALGMVVLVLFGPVATVVGVLLVAA